MSILKVANVHLETTGTNRIDYDSNGFTRIISGGTGGIVINTGGTDKVNVGANISVTGNLILNNKNVDLLISATSPSFDKANVANTLASAALPNTSGATFAGNLNITGNLNVGTTGSGLKLSVFGSANNGITSVTDNTSIVLDMTSNNNFAITLGGSNTFINPVVMNPGQSGVIWITQDGNGNRAPSWGSYWKFPSNTAPTLSTAASSVDAVVYIVRNSTSITAQAILNVG
jgi:hypothetical protein